MRPLTIVVHSYFQMYGNQKKLLEMNAPDIIIESGKKLLKDLSEELYKDHKFNINRFLKTPNGQELLHRELINQHSFEKARDRCHICREYTTNKGCKKNVMGMTDPYPTTCTEYKASGFSDELERIQAMINRCERCTHFSSAEEEYTCKEKQDMEELSCKYYSLNKEVSVL